MPHGEARDPYVHLQVPRAHAASERGGIERQRDHGKGWVMATEGNEANVRIIATRGWMGNSL